MTRVESPGNLDRWPDAAGRLITLILTRCGLRITVTSADDTQPWVIERAFVREGDVLLPVDKLIEQAPVVGVEAVLPAAVAAYRAGSGR
ncbi:hypothetical protein ACIGXI_22365 [Kitasatospora aureofaciens]|uniref:hypothetical protein n=1 Tax=Kitasatospora aureofaciens TaxID=1894 RepID=UPI0037C61EAF